MKNVRILQAVGLFMILAVAVGCRSNREYYEPRRPVYDASFSLIISPSPGFVMNRHPNGGYYYRSPQGFIYWRGPDNRFYLDDRYIGRVRYNEYEYRQWKQNRKKYGRGNGRYR